MKRRDFISRLAAMLAAATGPSVLALEAFDRFKWKATQGGKIAVINPDWINAPYEVFFGGTPEFERQFSGIDSVVPILDGKYGKSHRRALSDGVFYDA